MRKAAIAIAILTLAGSAYGAEPKPVPDADVGVKKPSDHRRRVAVMLGSGTDVSGDIGLTAQYYLRTEWEQLTLAPHIGGGVLFAKDEFTDSSKTSPGATVGLSAVVGTWRSSPFVDISHHQAVAERPAQYRFDPATYTGGVEVQDWRVLYGTSASAGCEHYFGDHTVLRWSIGATYLDKQPKTVEERWVAAVSLAFGGQF